MPNRTKPTAIKMLQGTARKSRMNPAEVQPVGELADPPHWLKGEALDEWNRVVKALPPGVLKSADASLLAAYCEVWRQFVAGAESGQPVNAALVAQLRYLAASFGLDPSSRAKVGGLQQPKPESVWAKIGK